MIQEETVSGQHGNKGDEKREKAKKSEINSKPILIILGGIGGKINAQAKFVIIVPSKTKT